MRAAMVLLVVAALVGAKDKDKGKPAKVRLTPKWKAKESVEVKLTEVTAQIRAGQETALGTRRIEYEQTTLAVKKGLPIRATRKFKVHELKLVFADEPRKHELAGQKITLAREDGLLRSRKAPALMSMGAGGDWTWMLPAKAVRVGDTWTVKKGMHLMAIGTAFINRDTKCRLASVAGDKAVIKFAQPGQLDGSAEFSLKAGRVLRASFTWLLKDAMSTSKYSFTYALALPAEKAKEK